jgi:hypothetical protein
MTAMPRSSVDRETGRMRARRWPWFLLGAVSGAALAAAAPILWSAVPIACPAVGFADLRPIQLLLPERVGASPEVSACFALNCTPILLEADESGQFAVPQTETYLGPGPEIAAVSTTGVYVRVRDGGLTVVSNRFGIRTVSDAPFWSPCPGPSHHAAVSVT